MKKFVLSLMVVVFAACAEVATEKDLSQFTSVHKVKALKGDIYDKTMQWVVMSFDSLTKSGIDYADKENGIIILKGTCDCSVHLVPAQFLVGYKLIINIKDYKYKTDLQPLSFDKTYNGSFQPGKTYKILIPSLKAEYDRIDKSLLEYIENSAVTADAF